MSQYAWTCSCCGKQYSTLPLDFGGDAPAYWYGIPREKRYARAVLTPDFCTVDGEDHFIRGCLGLPISTEERFVFGRRQGPFMANLRRFGLPG
jgi:hypothetical protein